MSNDKTLATVKHGGCVQLGDGPKNGEVYVEVSGLTGSGKSAIAGEIEILCRALGLDAEWVNGDEEKRLTHADWIGALEMYKPKVVIVERNVSRSPDARHQACESSLATAARAAIPFVAHAFSEGVTGAEEAGRAIEAALSAQPSPGGQEALATLIDQWMARADRHEASALEADSIGGMQMAVAVHEARAAELNAAVHSLKEALAARQPVRIYGCCAQPEGELHTAECPNMRHLAARQPVEFERAIPTRRRESAVELLLELGFVWNNQRWEDRRQPVGVPVVWVSPGQLAAHKDRGAGQGGNYLPTRLTRDGEFTRPLYDAPAQAVDLERFRPAVMTSLGLSSPNSTERETLRELLALIDSQAVGK